MTDLLPKDDERTQPTQRGESSGEPYVVVARRYRPQTFADLIGQEHVVQGLIGAIETNRVGHAFLFTGARGVGKTSAARILAKCLNCVKGPTTTPCNECDICLAISAGEDIDAIEIDGASNRRIEEIRQLRQNVGVRPSRARFKIYIIDEVHMLTNEAFNALLKTLEEPPEHVKFIFCTTEAEKIPITILSRCQRFDFAGVRLPQIVARLKFIADEEGVEVEPDALEILARRAAGSMRDSQSLLEQLLAFGKKKVGAADVHEMLGTATSARLGQLIGHLVARDAAGALAELDAAVNEGVDAGQFLEQLLGYLRDCMAAAVGCRPDAFRFAASGEATEIGRWSEQWGLETILAVMQILDQTLSRLRFSVHAQTLAEMAIVRICSLENLESLTALVTQLRDGTAPPGPATVARPASSAPSAAAKPSIAPPDEAKKKADLGEPAEADETDYDAGPIRRADAAHSASAEQTPSLNEDSVAATLVADLPHSVGAALTAESVPTIWKQVLANLSDILADYASFSSEQAILAPNRLAVRFTAKYNSCKAFCERPEQLSKLESALTAVTGQKVRVEFGVVDPPPGEEARAEPRRPVSARQRLQEKSQDPFVRRAMDLFYAQPVRVEEPES